MRLLPDVLQASAETAFSIIQSILLSFYMNHSDFLLAKVPAGSALVLLLQPAHPPTTTADPFSTSTLITFEKSQFSVLRSQHFSAVRRDEGSISSEFNKILPTAQKSSIRRLILASRVATSFFKFCGVLHGKSRDFAGLCQSRGTPACTHLRF